MLEEDVNDVGTACLFLFASVIVAALLALFVAWPS